MVLGLEKLNALNFWDGSQRQNLSYENVARFPALRMQKAKWQCGDKNWFYCLTKEDSYEGLHKHQD